MGRPAVVAVSMAFAVAFGAGCGAAHATGNGPMPPPPPCSFTLSAPARDGDLVTATVQSTGCAALAVPYSSVACLSPDGASGTRCEQSSGADPARVAVPYVAGVTFVATGRGCAGWDGLSPAPDCQALGPDSATP